jgi:hypothetical protein
MKNLNETILDLVDNIEAGNHIEANNIFNDLLQTKIDELLDAKKVEVSSDMFNTEHCADCDEEVEQTNEALKGAQHKIDVNKNGKLDAMDFKMLRKKKGMKEEASLSEDNPEWRAQLKKDRNAYWTPERVKAAQDKANSPEEVAKRKKAFDDMQANNRKMQSVINTAKKNNVKEAYADAYAAKKAAEMKKAKDAVMAAAKKEYDASQESKGKINTKNFMKKEEVEHIDELSKKTLKSYVKKATTSELRHSTKGAKEEDKSMATDGMKYPAKQERHMKAAGASYAVADKRATGIKLAKQKMREDVEHIDEASYSTKSAAAGKDIGKSGKMFSKIATKASRKYGKERGAKIAGAVLAKLRKKSK